MNIFEKLSIEIEGIIGNIKQYTGDDYIHNIVDKLEMSIEKRELEKTKFLLKKVNVWYAEEQKEIQSNDHVFNQKQHIKNQEILEELYEELKDVEKIPESKEDKEEEIEMKKIFISHSSEDKEICDGFIKLLEELGVPEEDILYTSSARHGVPCDTNIFEYLRKHIEKGITIYYMLSDNYYESAYCLNEMGAAWIVRNKFSLFFLPNFTRDIDGVIDNERKAFDLSSPIDLIEFKDKITEEYGTSISSKKWEEVKNEFLELVEE